MKENAEMVEKALLVRAKLKKKKPDFARQESWRYSRFKESWRKPKGVDNKMRRKIKGWPPTVNVGYRGPKVARGLHPSGYDEVMVHNVEELKRVNHKTQAVRIAHSVGGRTRAQILAEARRKKITILNVGVKEEKRKEAKEEKTEKEAEEEKKEEKLAEKEKPRGKQGRVKKDEGGR